MIGDFYQPFHKMVDSAIEQQTDKKSRPHPRHRSRFGTHGQGAHRPLRPDGRDRGPEGEKSRFASLRKGQLIESITLAEALELFALPRTLGELEGEELTVGTGKYGPYVRYGKSFASLPKGDDPYTVSYDRAVEIVRAHKAAAAAANQHAAAHLRRGARPAGQERPLRTLHRLQGQELPCIPKSGNPRR